MSEPTHHHFLLRTERLIVRPFEPSDLDAITAVLDEGFGAAPREARQRWLAWQIASYTELARLWQPPYGDRAVTLHDGRLIGAVGFVPCWGPFEKLPSFRDRLNGAPSAHFFPEFGLFWVIDAAHRGQGCAAEAAQAMIRYAFVELGVGRVVATTDHENMASQAVMRRLGMSVERNPDPDPEWFQVVGVLARPQGALARP
ncbi:MAG: GNAT family N-acetyltransferase [Anaerolineae bacterium]|nr:GNAT family N-acetyltransferase [Anaerolineae bacterium]NUQ04839.1 GNAT family N-acetyltransferase [Anaerolineae bacterium]